MSVTFTGGQIKEYWLSELKNEHGSVVIEKDNMDIGVFVMVQKPKYVYDYRLLNLDDYRLYNIVYDLRI